MKQLHTIIAILFAIIAALIYWSTEGEKWTPALVALLIANVSLAAIAIENAIDGSGRGPGGGF